MRKSMTTFGSPSSAMVTRILLSFCFFFFNDTATTEIYTLSLHDAVPIWLAGAAAAVLVVAILLAVKRAGGVALITSLFRVGLIAAIVLGVWLLVQQQHGVSAQGPSPGGERRALDDRKAALMVGSIAPGSALS